MMDIGVAIGTLGALVGIAFGYTSFLRNRRQDEQGDGERAGTLLTEIGYIKSGVDDIKRKQEKQDEKHLEIVARLAAVEAAAKQAHKRIDRLDETIYP